MTDNPVADLAAAIQWLKNKHAANRYIIDHIAEYSTNEGFEFDHMQAILKAVVSGSLAPTSTEPVAWAGYLNGDFVSVMREKPSGSAFEWRPLYALSGEKS